MSPLLARGARRMRLEPLEPRLALTAYFVSTTGNNAADGSEANPWRTLQYAADQVDAGDLVTVRAGNYAGFYVETDGTAANRITFRALAGVTINARNPVTNDGINLEGADYVTIEGFKVVEMPRTGIRSVLNHHVIIRNNVLDNNTMWGILTGFSDDLLIEGNTATRSQVEHGIYVSNSGDRPVIRNNVIWGNRANGIHMNGDASLGGDGIISGALVEGNVIYDNGAAGGSGINGDGVQNSTFRNNLIYNTHASGISLYQIDGGGGSSGNFVVNNTVLVASNGRWALNIQSGSTNNTVRNNIFLTAHNFRGSIDISEDSLEGFTSDYNVVMERFTTDGGDDVQTLAEWRASTGQDTHSIVATPTQLFINPAANDYHLSAASPAVDAGDGQFAPGVDFEGTSRPQGSRIDIGADERVSSTQPPATNRRPTNIALGSASVSELSGSGRVIGALSVTDPNAEDTHTLTLRNNAGGRFAISGNQIVVAAGARFDYEAATSHVITVQATDNGGLSFQKSFTINVLDVNEIVSFDVQRGASQRSFIRYVDLVFEDGQGLSELVASGRLDLTQYDLAGGGSGVQVSLAEKVQVAGNRVTIDFGPGGMGRSRYSDAEDGYYSFRLDLDGDGVKESARRFYRLLGDTNGDRVVNSADVAAVNANFGRGGANNADVDGSGRVNETDRDIVNRQQGRSIAASLRLDD